MQWGNIFYIKSGATHFLSVFFRPLFETRNRKRKKCVSCIIIKAFLLKTVYYSKFLLLFLFFLSPFYGHSLGVLTHEAIVDAAWDGSILPLLKTRYPSATTGELNIAHAYAYGGSVTPDMGYYPFGSHLFTNLVHYVRSGDMVNALLKDANNINEYAFALGFLSHYDADNYGHPMATNRSVPLVYSRMRRKYGNVITYAENKISHVRMEFGFDVLQTAKGNYASQGYHDFIGFKVDTSVLARAFLETYGLDINGVFDNHLLFTIEIFRFTVANIFPLITKSAWASKRSDILKKDKTVTSKTFRYKMHLREYNKEYGKGYKHPGVFPTMLSFFIRVLPKVGPTRALRFKIPTPPAEKYFDESFDTIMRHYTVNIQQLKQPGIILKDEDFDTGKPTELCEYSLADETYNRWLLELKTDRFKDVSSSIKQNILGFYNGMNAPSQNKYSKKCTELYNAFKDIKSYRAIARE